MKIYLSAITLALSIFSANSQTKLVHSLNRINLDVFATGVNYSKEFPIADRSTLEGSIGISSNYYFDDFAVQFRSKISVDYRFYYNIASRKRNGRNIHGNSASFIGATTFSHLFPINKIEQSDNESFLFGGAIFWGIRQQIKDSGFQVNFLAGPALAMDGLTERNPALYVRTGISYLF
ncbi:hypothetical protein [Sphingobacterium paludis]|uniref:Outer membrane protein with beta-barrel domain n=1 Tax=Sphingobacterium paludis TaxID=1476465 RepID=A0A4R7CTH0_9SPHI|nr:hypothetical protein [Sphingobacterium paludis]TDS10359.1 hypothetical protein B0I21_109124 [Sphingobacterium paludis]